MGKVKKAIIPAAGLGTRFVPATKAIPKEMLPIVDKPIILYVVEEAVRSGIEDIVIISGRGKGAIEDFFDCSYELEDKLAKDRKEKLLDQVKSISKMVNLISVRQKQALGLGHAVWCGRSVVGNEPFAVLLGDEIMVTSEHQPTVTGQLVELYQKTGLSAVAVMEVAESEVEKYGIIEGGADPVGWGVYRVRSVVEKPKVSQAPSRLALPGRYVFSSALFKFLENAKPGVNGEIQLTDAMTSLAVTEGLFATTFKARRFDAGDKLGYLQANVELALEHSEVGKGFRDYLLRLLNQL